MAGTLHERSERLLQNRIRNMKPGSKEFHFVFMGDSRGKNNDCFLSGEFELVLKKAVKRNPLFIVHGGDAVFTGKPEFMRHSVDVVEKVAPNIPMFVCVGNHDERFIGESNLQSFRTTIGKVHWAVNVPGFHYRCIALNNVINPGKPNVKPKYGFTSSELDYLEKQLKTSPRNTVLAMHVQPSVGRWAGRNLEGFPVDTASAKRFFHLLSQNKQKVKKVLVSHVHAYDEEFLQGDGMVSRGFTEFTVTQNRISSPDLWRVFGKPNQPCM